MVEPVRLPVLVRAGREELSGELVLPPGPGRHPAAILAPGSSGARDRREWVGALARSGVAVLTWDSPGYGESPGVRRWQAPDERALEVGAAVDLLRSLPALVHPGIGIIAIDNGVWSAALAAALASRVAALALLTPPCTGPGEQELVRLRESVLAHGLSPAEAELAAAVLQHRMRRIQLGHDADAIWAAEAPCWSAPWYSLLPGTRPVEIRAFASLGLYQLTSVLSGVRCPVLAVLGTDDPTVSAGQGIEIMTSTFAAVPGREFVVTALPRAVGSFHGSRSAAPVGRLGDWSPGVVLCLADWLVARIRLWRNDSDGAAVPVPRPTSPVSGPLLAARSGRR